MSDTIVCQARFTHGVSTHTNTHTNNNNTHTHTHTHHSCMHWGFASTGARAGINDSTYLVTRVSVSLSLRRLVAVYGCRLQGYRKHVSEGRDSNWFKAAAVRIKIKDLVSKRSSASNPFHYWTEDLAGVAHTKHRCEASIATSCIRRIPATSTWRRVLSNMHRNAHRCAQQGQPVSLRAW